MGYGAMQLAGPQVWGPPRDLDAAIAVLREAVPRREPHRHQRLLRSPRDQSADQAGAPSISRGSRDCHEGGRSPGRRQVVAPRFFSPGADRRVHDNLRNLGLDTLDVVNLRSGRSAWGRRRARLRNRSTVLAELQRQGLIRHIGLSNVTPTQFAEGADHRRDRLRAECLQRGPPER